MAKLLATKHEEYIIYGFTRYDGILWDRTEGEAIERGMTKERAIMRLGRASLRLLSE